MGYSEFADDMQVAGIASGMIYGYTAGPPYNEHRCPGCQPRPELPWHAEKWDKWHAINGKWMTRIAEPHMCPVMRGETLPPVVSQVRPTLPHPLELAGGRKCQELVGAQIAPEESAEVEEDATPQKTRTQRARKAKEVSKGQSSLF